MPEVELKKPLKLSDLVVGGIFDDIEVIIDLDKKIGTMTTITNQTVKESEKWYDMRTFMYDFETDSNKNIVKIVNNGYCKISDEDPIHDEYLPKLKKKEIWFEDK